MEPFYRLLKKGEIWNWLEQHEQQTFVSMKNKLITAPALAQPDFEKLFYVVVDASSIGLRVTWVKVKLRTRKLFNTLVEY